MAFGRDGIVFDAIGTDLAMFLLSDAIPRPMPPTEPTMTDRILTAAFAVLAVLPSFLAIALIA